MTTPETETKPAAKWFEARARQAMKVGDLQTALSECEQGLEIRCWNEQLWALKVNILTRLGKFPEALAVVNDTSGYSKHARVSPAFQMRAFEVYLELGDLDGARHRLELLGNLDPDHGIHYLICVGKLGLATGDHIECLAELEPRLPKFRAHGQLCGLVARNMAACGRVAEALDLSLDTYLARKNVDSLVIYVRILLDDRRVEEAEQFLAHYSAHVARTPRLMLEKLRILERREEFAAAVTLLRAGLADFPGEISLHSAYWRMLTLTGDGETAARLSREFAAGAGASVRAVLAAVRYHYVSGRPEDGDEILAGTAAENPGNPLVMLRAAHSELEHRFNPQAAVTLLDDSDTERHDSKEFAKVRAKSLRQMGFIPEAIEVLIRMRDHGGLDSDASFQLTHFLALIGKFDDARAVLDGIEKRSKEARTRKHSILADIAFQEGDLSRARHHILRAIALRGRDGVWYDVLAKYQIHAGDYAAAWTNHAASIERMFTRQMSRDVTNKPIKSLMGQLLNEYRLFYGDRDTFGPRWDASVQPDALRFFRAELTENPGNTPAALGVMSALRRTGAIGEQPSATGAVASIPKIVYQFWDKPAPPAQVAEVMAWNRKLNPDYEFRRFDLKHARDYFLEKEELDAFRAYRLAPEVAGKADIFRLTVLWHDGGVYLDADDRCVRPFSTFLDHSQRFTGYQETYWTVGNNFMAVRPGDPIIRAALEDAIQAFLGPAGASVWLSSGPGAITRSLALHGTDENGALAPDIWVMPLHRMYQLVVPHIRLTYKTTDVHWIRRLQKR